MPELDPVRWLLASLRVGGALFAGPVFASRFVPIPVRVGLAMLVGLLVQPAFGTAGSVSPDLGRVASLAFQELAVGLAAGWLAQLLFTVVEVGGELLDFEIGFGVSNVIDPISGVQQPLVANFLSLLASLLYLAIGGDRMLIGGIAESYRALPPGGIAWPDGGFSLLVVRLFSAVFSASLAVVLPVLGALFLTTVALALLARAMPQLNAFVTGLPAKTAIGLGLLAIALPFWGSAVAGWLGRQLPLLRQLFEVLGGGG